MKILKFPPIGKADVLRNADDFRLRNWLAAGITSRAAVVPTVLKLWAEAAAEAESALLKMVCRVRVRPFNEVLLIVVKQIVN